MATTCICFFFSILIYTTLTLFCLNISFVQAMFFTDSKDNDYPRIGKRPLPSMVYRKWINENLNEKIRDFESLPYETQRAAYEDGIRHMRDNFVFPGLSDLRRTDNSPSAPPSHATQFDDQDSEVRFWNYLRQNGDLEF